MAPRLLTRTGLSAAATMAIILGGCAVMRIDVDVYKGPLANHEDVQIQQFAAMAIGAKPLLTQLRDHLQWPNPDVRACIRDEPWYRSGQFQRRFHGECGSSDRQATWSERAERVNAVLTLYDDQDVRGLGRFIGDGTAAVEKYGSAISILRGRDSNEEEKEEEWQRIESGLVKMDDASLGKHFGIGVSTNLVDVRKGLIALKTSYRDMFGLADRNELNSAGLKDLRSNRAVQNAYGGLVTALRNAGSSRTNELKAGILKGTSSNAHFADLSQPRIVGKHVDALFEKSDGREAELFRGKVVGIAKAFHEARGQLLKLWNTALDALTFVAMAPEFDNRTGNEIVKSYAKLVAFLTQEWHLAAAIHSEGNAPPNVKKELKKILHDSELVWQKEEKWNVPRGDFNFDAAETSLEEVIINYPVAMASLLKEAHGWFQEVPEGRFDPPAGEQEDTPRKKLSEFKSRQYGLVRGPTFRQDELDQFLRDWREVKSVARAVGFEGGRLQKGIETLIREYVDSTEIPNPNARQEEQIEHRRVQLKQSLIRFSEKVLFIANYDTLITQKASAQGTDASNSPDLDRYILVLQAVGNSIQSLADELTHREKHDEKLEARTAGERRALAEAISRTNEKSLDFILAILRSRRDSRAAAEAEQAMATDLEDFAQNAVNAKVEDRTQDGVQSTEADKIRSRINGLMRNVDAIKVLKGQSPANSTDVNNLKAAVKQAENSSTQKITADAARVAMVGWLSGQIRSFTRDMAEDNRRVLFVNARRYFRIDAKGTYASIEEDDGNAVFAAIEAQESGKETSLSDLILSEHDKARGLKQSADAKVAAAIGSRDRAEAAIKEISARRKDILVRAAEGRFGGDAARLKSLIVEKLDEAKRTEEAKPETDRNEDLIESLGDAKDELETVPAPKLPGAQLLAADKSSKSSQDILDDMIALLRYELILAQKQHGKSSNEATNVADALATAYEQRAGLAFIRPSGAYLRNSYPATSLQEDPAIGWRRNMLEDHAVRTTPLLAHMDRLLEKERDKNKRRIVAEIDKQFWHNINSVRVAGTGTTNYVIAKDDVGNWYVKSYSSNPEPIIRSAKSLALFGFGSGLNQNLLARARQQELGEAADPATLRAVNATPTGRIFLKQKQKYESATDDHYKGFRALIENGATSALVTKIYNAWKASAAVKEEHRENLKKNLDSAATETLVPAVEELGEESASADKKAAAIITALATVRSLYPTLKAKAGAVQTAAKLDLDQKQAALDKSEKELREEMAKPDLDRDSDKVSSLNAQIKAQKGARDDAEKGHRELVTTHSAALAEAQRIIREEVIKLAEKRIAAVDEYQSAIVFIGDANNPKPELEEAETEPQTLPTTPQTPAPLGPQ